MEHRPPRKNVPLFFSKFRNKADRERFTKLYKECLTAKKQDEVCVEAKKIYEAELLGTAYITRQQWVEVFTLLFPE